MLLLRTSMAIMSLRLVSFVRAVGYFQSSSSVSVFIRLPVSPVVH